MKSSKHIFFCSLLFYSILKCLGKQYSNYSLYDAYPKTNQHIQYFRNLQMKSQIDNIVLNEPVKGEITQIFVNRAHKVAFEEAARAANLSQELMFDDVERQFEQQMNSSVGRSDRSDAKIYEGIVKLPDLYKWLTQQANSFSDIAKLRVIGKSAEGRDIPAFVIKYPTNDRYRSPKVIIECGIHGNEWISTNFGTYAIENLLSVHPNETSWRQYEWNIIPVLNPDGYDYALTQDRLWKKNRRLIDANNTGVNLNRNFDYRFGKYSDRFPDSQDYHGPSPFSEPETAALRDFVTSNKQDLTFYYAIHGHGEKVILPFADSTKHVINYHEVMAKMKKVLTKTLRARERPYKLGNAHELLGKLYSGDSASWVKSKFHVPYVLTLQLRDNGEYGLLMPVERAGPACQEMGDALFELVSSTKGHSVRSTKFSGSTNVVSSFIFMLICLFIAM